MFGTAFTLAAAVGYGMYAGEETPAPFYKLEVGYENAYLWGSYEDTKLRMIGQPIGDGVIIGLGAGYRYEFNDDLYVFGEVGYGQIEQGNRDVIQQEVVYTELVDRHNVHNRPVPLNLTGPYDQDSYETEWELKGGLMAALGVGYRFNDWSAVELAYRPFIVDEHIEVYDEQIVANGGGWWQETRSKDLSAFQVIFKFNW